MKILLWHGYLLGGTGSNVYTRALAREWTRAGHEVTVFSQEPDPGLYDLGGAATVRPDVGGLLPVFVLDRYEGYEVKLVQDCTRAELDAWVERNAAALREHLPADLVFANHVLLGGPVGAASGCAVRGQGARLRARVLDARQRGARRVGEGGARSGPRRSSSAPRTSGRCWRTSSATSTASTRCRRASTSTTGGRGRATEALAGLLEEARLDPPNPGSANERLPDEGNAERLASLPRRRTSRRSSTSGSSSTTRESTSCWKRCGTSMLAR